jgi:16S rRNA (uracil1498-N3)-methyltransferase
VRVRRLGAGDRVTLFDGRGTAIEAEIVSAGREGVEFVAAAPPVVEPLPSIAVSLATAVPKGDRFDWLVEKATEIGVVRLIPFRSERSVVDPRGSKLDRLRRSIIEASKQCGRSRLMILEEPVAWSALVRASEGTIRLLADPSGPPPSQWPAIAAPAEVILAIGPEGGFSSAEVEEAGTLGWAAVGLGRTLLRIETAGLAGCASILARSSSAE